MGGQAQGGGEVVAVLREMTRTLAFSRKYAEAIEGAIAALSAPPSAPVGVDLVAELKALRKAYVRLLETGRDRIRDLGGDCDPVDVMERGDIDLRRTDAALRALAQQPAAVDGAK